MKYIQQLPIRNELPEPDRDEALRQLTVGKVGGVNSLLNDVLKCCGGRLLEYTLKLFGTSVCPQRG